MTMQRYFLTGTDTDAGKSLITAALLYRARLDGKTSFGLKPVASGSDWLDGILQNRDALLHQQYSKPSQDYAIHNPLTFEPAIAPHIAAEQAGKPLTVNNMRQACEAGLAQAADLQIIEGAGGWRVPLNNTETLADFARELELPVILVVGLRLGCINHACLTAEAIEADGLKVAGWVANGIDPHMDVQQDNLNYLLQWFERRGIKHLGTVPHLQGIDPFNPEELKAVADCLRWP